MGKPGSRLRLISCVVWIGMGAAVWLLVVNRELMHWPNELAKTTAMVALGAIVFVVTAAIGLRVRRMKWNVVASLVLCAFALGEAHRVWLRFRYQASAFMNASPELGWLHPVTTTDLLRKHHVLTVPQQLRSLRVVHLTDLHLTPALPWAYYQSIVERTNAEQPDLVLMTGDLLTKPSHLPLLERWLRTPFRARIGVYAVLGNHEVWAGVADEVRRLLVAANVRVLSGRCERLSAGQFERVVLCGTEAPWGSDYDGGAIVENGDLVLALSHTPDNIYVLRGRANAVFAGHLHGGQMRIPGVGAVVVPSVYGRRFDRGHFVVDGTDLFVSAGLGADVPPLRLYCPAELLVVDFVGRGADGAAVASGEAAPALSDRVN